MSTVNLSGFNEALAAVFSYGEGFHMKMLVKIWNIFADVLLVVALVLVFAFVGAKFIGYTPYVVTSGSMQSIYPVGSIIYVKDAEPQDVQVGDAITFYLSGDTVATHQVWEIDTNQREFRTQGVDNLDENGNIIHDANPVSFDNLIGKPTLCVPKLGVLYEQLQKPFGLCVVAFVAILVVLVSVLTAPKKENAKKE